MSENGRGGGVGEGPFSDNQLQFSFEVKKICRSWG